MNVNAAWEKLGSVSPAGCAREPSPFPTVQAVVGASDSASAHAVPGPAGRSLSASRGTSGHPMSGSDTDTKRVPFSVR